MKLRELYTNVKAIIAEGGNLVIGSQAANRIDSSKRSTIVPLIDQALSAINNAYTASQGHELWSKKLLSSRQFLAGSSFHFFNQLGISDEIFSDVKRTVGDIDTHVDRKKNKNVREWLSQVPQGTSFGPAKFVGFDGKDPEQVLTLWQFPDIVITDKNNQLVPVNIQIDLEMKEYVDDLPTEWSKFATSSEWDDLSVRIKGVFHKFLIQSLTRLTNQEFLLRKMTGRGKNKIQQDVPTTDNMWSFAIKSKEGGGLRPKYQPIIDPDTNKPLEKDGLLVYQAADTTGYEKDLIKIFSTIFGDRISADELAASKNKLWSFVGINQVLSTILTPEEKNQIISVFIDKIFGSSAQGLYADDPKQDESEKSVALNKMLEILNTQEPHDLQQKKLDYYTKYRVRTKESITEAVDYKRKGIQHLYNPGSSTEMKDLEFIELCREINANSGTLDGIDVNLKVDGSGIRFGKDSTGKPFFMTSKVTTPLYINNVGSFETFGVERGQTGEQLRRTKLYDSALKTIVTGDFIKTLPVDTIVQAEMMYNPMAESTDQGLKFVNIPYDPKKLGSVMTLVPFMVKTFSSGDVVDNAESIIKHLVAASTSNIKIISNKLPQKNVDVGKIIEPVINLSQEMIAALTSRVKNNPLKATAKEIITKTRKELSDAIINNPNIRGKNQLGSVIEGLVLNMPSGRLAKVTSPEMKSAMLTKKSLNITKPANLKTAVVAIGSFVGHRGHLQLWDYTLKQAEQVGGDPYLFIGAGFGPDDPIPPSVKVQTWHKMFPEYKNNISTVTTEGGSLVQKIKHELINPQPGQSPKYDNIIIMVGEDQKNMNIHNVLMKAVNKFPGYEHVTVSLEATPRGTGMSFSRLRNILKDPNASEQDQLNLWMQGFDEKKLGIDWIKHLMEITRKNMKELLPMKSKKIKTNDVSVINERLHYLCELAYKTNLGAMETVTFMQQSQDTPGGNEDKEIYKTIISLIGNTDSDQLNHLFDLLMQAIVRSYTGTVLEPIDKKFDLKDYDFNRQALIDRLNKWINETKNQQILDERIDLLKQDLSKWSDILGDDRTKFNELRHRPIPNSIKSKSYKKLKRTSDFVKNKINVINKLPEMFESIKQITNDVISELKTKIIKNPTDLTEKMNYLEFEFSNYLNEVNSKKKSLKKSVKKSMPQMLDYPSLSNSNHPYSSYRFGVALARSPKDTMSTKGPFSDNFAMIDYTDADAKIRQGAEKAMGVKSRKLNTKKSSELTSANTASPVAKIKKNKYGV